MRKFFFAFFLAGMVWFTGAFTFAQSTLQNNSTLTPQKIADIKKLLDVTGSSKLGQEVIHQVIGEFKKISPNVPDSFWEKASKEANPSDLEKITISIYDKYLSDDDIKGLVAFYQSPLGQKVVKVMPQISRESMAAARQWGIQFVEKIESDLKAQGYENNTGASPSTGSPTNPQHP
jgi:hypothetical protein